MERKPDRPFKRKDGIQGHIVNIDGVDRAFIALSGNFNFIRKTPDMEADEKLQRIYKEWREVG
ncbi:MAG: hypothetical protein A2163_07795 [Actinobacteria bacterium RBG_13_35_12]|nr:MAG: hypothetical protein A2163_07795 [Actinobacteria bacterium RBG_13_35_12]